ncbi:4575_t:CDS:2 [Dentiscutata erythropus]|uniref:4575_t:CDS:1 n=1 Tax=Dentiscutata erythropus TaxID=1348616 RepID=A0A9N9GX65_9GLOM|nr:4575_t:CDS:2 [Dentiscutata erythropus]
MDLKYFNELSFILSSYRTLFEILCLGFIIYTIKFYYSYLSRENKLPGPLPLPLTGNLYCFIFGEIRQTLLTLQEKYGSVFELYLGVNREIIIGDPKLLDGIYDKSSSSVFQKRIIPGAVSLGLDVFQRVRKIIYNVTKKIFDANDQQENFELDLNIWMLEIFGEIFIKLILGETESKTILQKVLRLPKRMALWFKITCLYYVLPISDIKYLPFLNTIKKRFVRDDGNFRNELDHLINLKRIKLLERNKNISDKDERNDDVLTILIDEDVKNKSHNVMEIDNENIINLLSEMINGGVITTNKSLLTNYDYVNNLTYIGACVKESLRLISTILFSSRSINSGGTVCNMQWKEEQEFVIHHNYIHQNTRYWDNPKSFIPERFIDANNIIKNSHDPFGNGVRECPGKFLALFTIKITVVLIWVTFTLMLIFNISIGVCGGKVLESFDKVFGSFIATLLNAFGGNIGELFTVILLTKTKQYKDSMIAVNTILGSTASTTLLLSGIGAIANFGGIINFLQYGLAICVFLNYIMFVIVKLISYGMKQQDKEQGIESDSNKVVIDISDSSDTKSEDDMIDRRATRSILLFFLGLLNYFTAHIFVESLRLILDGKFTSPNMMTKIILPIVNDFMEHIGGIYMIVKDYQGKINTAQENATQSSNNAIRFVFPILIFACWINDIQLNIFSELPFMILLLLGAVLVQFAMSDTKYTPIEDMGATVIYICLILLCIVQDMLTKPDFLFVRV